MSYIHEYLRLSLAYYRKHGRAWDTIAALRRAIEKYEQAVRRG